MSVDPLDDPAVPRQQPPPGADPSGPPVRRRDLGGLLLELVVAAMIVVVMARVTSGIRTRTDILIVTTVVCVAFVGTRHLFRWRRSRRQH